MGRDSKVGGRGEAEIKARNYEAADHANPTPLIEMKFILQYCSLQPFPRQDARVRCMSVGFVVRENIDYHDSISASLEPGILHALIINSH